MATYRAYEYPAGDRAYTFDGHCVGHGYVSHIAVDVKYRGSYDPALSPEHQRKLERLLRQPDGPTEEDLQRNAQEDVQENWWAWAVDLAKSYALGMVYSEGRQGGWLVLNDWTHNRVEEACSETEERCKHCDGYEEDHVNEQCLFQSTQWVPAEKLPHATQESLDTLQKYVEEIEASLAGTEADLVHAYQCIIDYEHDDVRGLVEPPAQMDLFETL